MAHHLHFRAVTTMSPLQFRNALRFQSARRMTVAEGLEAATAGFEFGFQRPSQFSRDYARFFGASPLRDACNRILSFGSPRSRSRAAKGDVVGMEDGLYRV